MRFNINHQTPHYKTWGFGVIELFTMAKLIYFGTVDENGILKLTNKNGFANDLKDFIGKEVRLTVERKAKRSNALNAYFHAVIVPIIKQALIDAGWREAKSDEWVKDFIKYHCLVKEFVSEQGEVIKSLGKTSELTSGEFLELIADCQKWAAEYLNVYIPDPNEQTEIDL